MKELWEGKTYPADLRIDKTTWLVHILISTGFFHYISHRNLRNRCFSTVAAAHHRPADATIDSSLGRFRSRFSTVG